MSDSTTISRREFVAGTGAGLLGLALPSSLLAACGGDSGGADKVALWMDIAGAKNQRYFDTGVVAPFEKASQLDLDVKYYQGADLRRLIQTALQAKSGPDIVRGASATQTLAWADAHLLADLTPYERKYGWDDHLLRWSIDAFRRDGKLWAMPLRLDTMLLYYNASLFEKNGWQPPKSREELEALAQEAHAKGIIPFGATNVDWPAAPEWLMTLFWNHYAGPDAVYKALTGEVRWTDQVFVDAVALLKSYFDKGWFGGGVDKYFAVPSDEMGARFGQGEVAMFPQGQWWMSGVSAFFGEAAGNDSKWDWAPFPSLRAEVPYPTFAMGIGGSLGINAASEKKDRAAEFIDWYYTNDRLALRRMADVPATYNIPIEIEAGEIPSNMDPRSQRLLTSLNDAVRGGSYGYVTWTWWPAKADVYVYEGLEKVLQGQLSPRDYLAQMDARFQQGAKGGELPQIIEPGVA
jgi:raffinose/stachyose/melibiose transport system substrate-binding protein